ncbi:MAG: hypothetical protein ISP91_07875 [Pseudomonadales bacterium]|nr:hypothetical protein [Pseudomonadales bacterium]
MKFPDGYVTDPGFSPAEDCIGPFFWRQEQGSFHADFTAAAGEGELVTCRPEVTRKTGSMVFVSGNLISDGQVVMTFSSVVKRLRNE